MTITALAFDFGTQNIGVAYGQTLTAHARELPPLKARDGIPQWDVVGELLREWQPDKVIVGLPLNMDGSTSEFAQRAQKFGRRLEGRFSVSVEMMDERLSTFAAKEEAKTRGHQGNFHQDPIDSIAARLILESWLAQHNHAQA